MTLIIPCLHEKCRRRPARLIGMRKRGNENENENENANAAMKLVKFIAESGESE